MSTLTLRSVSSQDLQIPGPEAWYASPGDPALPAALEHMKHNGIRCAFVIDEAR